MYPNSYNNNYQSGSNYNSSYTQPSTSTLYPQNSSTSGQGLGSETQGSVSTDQQGTYNYQQYGYNQYGYNNQYNPQYMQTPQNYSVPNMGYGQSQFGYSSQSQGSNYPPMYQGYAPPQFDAQGMPQSYQGSAQSQMKQSTAMPATHSAFSSGDRKRKRSPNGGRSGHNSYGYHSEPHTGFHSGYHSNSHHSGHNNRRQSGENVPKRQVRISNLPDNFCHSSDALREYLSSVGSVMCMNIPHYHDTGKPRNYAFVKFSTEEEAARACSEFNGKNIYGSVLEVVIANKQAEYSGRTNTIQVENLPYDALDSQIRDQFSKHGEIVNFKLVKHHKSHRATAIIEYRFGSSVQNALNEYHNEVYVGEAVESLVVDPRNKRRRLEVSDNYEDGFHHESHSQQTFDENVCEVYVGRLPPQLSSNKEELQRIFEPFGDIGNIDIIYDHANGLPKGIAYIRYYNPMAASQACKHLDQSSYYSRSIVVQLSKRQQQAQVKPKAPSGDVPIDNEAYFANLPTGTTEDDVRSELCNSFDDLDSVLVTELPPTAFVKFKSPESVSRVINQWNEKTFKDRTLLVRHSLRTDFRGARMPEPDEKLNFEIHVGNLPYDHCSESTLRKIFSICGEIANVRLPAPHRQSNIPRGFAFVQFTNVDSALRALSLHGMIVDNRAMNVSFPNVPPPSKGSSGPKSRSRHSGSDKARKDNQSDGRRHARNDSSSNKQNSAKEESEEAVFAGHSDDRNSYNPVESETVNSDPIERTENENQETND